ncbi:MAG: hypothetical protein ACOZNI_27990 [Myxococcota bacterium]
MTSSRYIRARVVNRVEFAGELARDGVAGPRRKRSPKQREIRRKLRKAFRLKKRIAHLRIRKPLGWKGAVRQAKTNLRVVMSDLKLLGWKPKKPRRALKPGEDEMDAALEDIPEAEPADEDDDPDEELEELPDAPETEGDGNWLDAELGVWPFKPKAKPGAPARPAASAPAKPAAPKRNVLDTVKSAFAPKWSKPIPLGDGGQIQTRPGQRAMVATVSPGLFIVQLVSDAAVKKIAGDNVGILPLVLYPLVKQRIQQKLTPNPEGSPAQPAPPAPGAAPTAAGVGCDPRRTGS